MRRAATFGEPGTCALDVADEASLGSRPRSFLASGVGPRRPRGAPSAPEQSTAVYEPSRALDGLFHDVQLSGVFPDSKTFVDARPLETPAQITAAYATERSAPGFLAAHVRRQALRDAARRRRGL